MTARGGAGLWSLALKFPEQVRTNGWFRTTHPDVVAEASERGLARLFADGAPRNRFDAAMRPYVTDVFRGARERRILAHGETTAQLEAAAGRDALARAGLAPHDIDLLISSSFLPDEIGIGNGVYVARELGLRCAGWNLETACTGAVAALDVASGLVRAGVHRHVLVTASCAYSRTNDPSDTTSWFLGDGATAFVVGPVAEHAGVLASHAVHTAPTCGTWSYALEQGAGAAPRVVMRAAPGTGRVLSDTAEPTLRECADAALAKAGLTLADVAFVATTTPTAWFADFVAAALPIARSRTLSVFPRYANVGPVLVPASLAHAAKTERLRKDDVVLCFAIGSVSSASALVMRWGDVAVAPLPPGGNTEVR